jgi:hypothetical protein
MHKYPNPIYFYSKENFSKIVTHLIKPKGTHLRFFREYYTPEKPTVSMRGENRDSRSGQRECCSREGMSDST